jgi:hypothetical protein
MVPSARKADPFRWFTRGCAVLQPTGYILNVIVWLVSSAGKDPLEGLAWAMAYRPPKKPNPILIGPDANGLSILLTGDYVSWIGSGDAPTFPRTMNLSGEFGVLVAPKVTMLEGAGPSPRELLLKGYGAGIAVSDHLTPEPSAHLVRQFAHSGFRLVHLIKSARVLDPLLLIERSIFWTADDRRRFALLDQDSNAQNSPFEFEDFAMLRIGQADLPRGSDDRRLLGTLFGRPACALSLGAVGDVVLMDQRTGLAIHAVIGGRLVLHDGMCRNPDSDLAGLSDSSTTSQVPADPA